MILGQGYQMCKGVFIMKAKVLLRIIFLFIFSLYFITTATGQEQEKTNEPFVLFIPIGYDFVRLENQTIHAPASGIGFLLGEQDVPFTEVDRRVMGLFMYQPYIFSETPYTNVPKTLHQVIGVIDFRLRRHQFLVIFQTNSDEPVYGGLQTITAGAGYGYEVIRKPNFSLILGGIVGVSDFDFTPVMPLPLIRFGVDTQWFVSSFEFITGPNLEFTIAPKERIRFTADMRMDNFRSLADLDCEFILWYRLFNSDHKMGDFAGLGLGFKNELTGFDLSDKLGGYSFEIQRSSIIAAIDLSILQFQAGWIFDSNYIFDDKKTGSPGNGFFISVQGMIPIINK